MERRVVITGMGLISPLGDTGESLWESLSAGRSGIAPLERIAADSLPCKHGAEARGFSGAIEDFGPLDKTLQRNIRKSLKMMCREIAMGVAAAQRALADAGWVSGSLNPERAGVVYGVDHIFTMPEEFSAGIANCLDHEGRFQLSQWGRRGLGEVNPLWLLKYLPNMPASHIAIFNAMCGPNNSLTLREAGSNAAITESARIIGRGGADVMLAGATGTRIHPIRTLHVVTQEEIAGSDGAADDPARLARPFDLNRTGMVLGEGAGAVVLESRQSAESRGAEIWGEVVGFGSSTVQTPQGLAGRSTALANAMTQALHMAGMAPEDVGHIHAHGLGTRTCDIDEAKAIRSIFGDAAVPVTAAKSYFGNLGAAGGLVELISSLLSLRHGELFRTLNYDAPDPECPIPVAASAGADPGASVLNVNVTPQGQAAAVLVRKV
ncbi:MAG: beta-ketoacyl-[acyl-carrier-protein] synthase family protein [Planctomycetes bacterium]|nr:beta-ketoacyl-[acyl-carrier-protein] synthase family protein [Planctomycetota bacterium]